MANYAQTVNVIGAIKTTKTAAAFDTTGLVLKLYRAHFGLLPVGVSGETGPLDVAAAWREDRSALTLAIVNPTVDQQAIGVQLKGGTFAPFATLRRIAGTDPQAYNEPGKPPAVKIEETTNVTIGDRLTVPPLSVSIYEVRAR
jgi:alpha-N-arabinofuranosidase